MSALHEKAEPNASPVNDGAAHQSPIEKAKAGPLAFAFPQPYGREDRNEIEGSKSDVHGEFERVRSVRGPVGPASMAFEPPVPLIPAHPAAAMTRALFINGVRDVRVAPFNLREGREDEVLIDVAAVGVCGSDLHYYKDGGIGSAVIAHAFAPGHEFGG